MDTKKWQFIGDELVACSIRGAFQRVKVYSDTCTDGDRKRIQERLDALLRGFSAQYSKTVSSENHEKNVRMIADFLTSEFAGTNVLRGNRFRIGVAQKALNLYLKYLWCLGKVATPPHCPFDFGIIARLPLTDEQKKGLRWTELDSMEAYRTLVDAGLQKTRATGHSSLSEWELEQWKRRS